MQLEFQIVYLKIPLSTISIEIEGSQTVFSPGQTVRGTVRWLCLEPPKKAGLQLLWYTEGKGDEDVGLVKKIKFDGPQASGNHRFEFQLPVGPYSFSGRLISLTWALELQVDKECARKELVVSPDGSEIQLTGKT